MSGPPRAGRLIGSGENAALGERLGMGMLLAGMGLGLSLQFALAWAGARPAAGPPPFVLFAGVLLATLTRSLASLARDDGGSDNEIAWTGLLLASGLTVAFLHFGPSVGLPALLSLACVWAGWWMTGYLWRNLLLAVPAPRDPDAGPQVDAHGQSVGTGAVDVAANVQAGAFGGLLAAAAVALLGQALSHGRHPAHLLLGALAMTLQAACAALLVAQGQRRALLRQSALYQARVLPGFATGSAAGALVVTAAFSLLALVLPSLPGLLTPHGLGAGVARVVGGIVGHAANPGAVPLTHPGTLPQGTATTGGGGGHTAGQTGLAGPITVVAAVLILVALGFGVRVGVAMVRGAMGKGVPFWQFLREAWEMLLALLEAFFSGGGFGALWRLLAGGGSRRERVVRADAGGGPRRASLLQRLTDPRLRVRAAYRQMLAGLGGKGHRRPVWFSPGRFRRQVQAALPPRQEDLSRLTTLYEEARYSAHVVAAAAAGEAEAAAQSVVRSARQASGDEEAPSA